MSGNFMFDTSTLLTIQRILDQTFMIVKITCEGKIIEVNELFLKKFQYTADELMWSSYLGLINREKSDWQEIWNEIQQGKQWNGESCLVTKYGKLKWLESTFIPVLSNGDVQQVIALHVDKTDQKNAKKWKRLAFRHELTQLPNRRKLLLSIDEHICKAEQDDTKFAVLFIDLNQFKLVNDRYGHTIGDMLLIEVGKRISQMPLLNECVFHLSGDEFVILLEDLDNLDFVIESIFVQFDKFFKIEEHRIEVSVSIGTSIYPDDSMNARRLMELADDAMYEAKRMAGNSYKLAEDSSLVNKGYMK